MSPEQQQLEATIAALEAQRALLGNETLEMALAPLRRKLAALHSPESSTQQQLKQVSVLFIDVVGSTAMGEQLDPEEIHAVIDGALERFTAVVHSHHGLVLKYTGDGILAVFGAEEASEDDVESAIRAGLGIIEDARRQAPQIRQRHGVPDFSVRAGVHTGTVLLGGGVDTEGSIRGTTVNIAARMEQSAPPGSLRISQGSYRHVRGVFDVELQPPMEVKGLDQPIVTYLVQRAKPRAFRVSTRGVEGVETPMVGRNHELRRLQQAFLGLSSNDDGRSRFCAVTVVAEAGIGKSRLLYEFQNWAESRPEGFLAFLGRARSQAQAQPYGLLRDMLAWRLQISESDSGAVARDKLTAGVAPMFDQDGESHAHLLGHLIGLEFAASAHLRGILQDAGQIRARGFHAAAQFLRRMAKRSALPVVLMLDDLHWADDGSLDFIDHLIRANRDMPLLLLGLTRPGLFERRPDWAGAAPVHHRIDLQPLNHSDSRALADALLQRVDDAPTVLRELITGGAEGNPYYMEELLKMLVDEGAILTDRQPWQVLPDKLVAAKVPATLTGVLQARLDTLPERDKRVLQQASVVGMVFWDRALNALCVDAPTAENLVAAAADTAGALESLPRRELIHARRPSAFAGTHEFAFKHQILQQVTYHGLLKRQRRQYHARAAAWLIGLTGDRETEHLGATAEHYERSGDHVNACRLFARAAQWAVSRGANTAMLTYVQRALALCASDDHVMRWQLLAARERFLVTSDDRAAHAAELDAMQALAEALDDDARRADVLWRRAFALDDSGDFAAAALMAQGSLDLALAAGATAVATKAYAGLGYDLMRLGRFRQAQQAVDAGLALARASGNRSLEPHFLTDAGGIARAQGDPAMAMAHFEEALAVTRELGNRGNEAMMLNNLGDSALRLGDYLAARRHLLASLEVARATGNRTSESLALQNLAAVAHQQGGHAEALDWAQAALEIQRAMGLHQQEATSLLVLGHAQLGLGQPDAARASYERSHGQFEAVGMQAMAMEALAGLARVALAQGETAQAQSHVKVLLEHRARGGKFDGSEEPLRIGLTCWQVSRAANEARADVLLAEAHAELQAQAATITDAMLRHSFLNNIPEHREIVAAWAAYQAASARGH